MDDEFDDLNQDKTQKKLVNVKQSMAPIQELIYFKKESMWNELDDELEKTKTLDNAYFMDASFLYSLSLLNLWIGNQGAFLMPKREVRHRHYVFSLFWQPSAPNKEKNTYVVPARLNGLLRWYLTRDNFINKEISNRIVELTFFLKETIRNKLIEKGWGVYIMNMTTDESPKIIFRKGNERGYQPYFGSTVKSNLKDSYLPESKEEDIKNITDEVQEELENGTLIDSLIDLTTCGVLYSNDFPGIKDAIDDFKKDKLPGLKKELKNNDFPKYAKKEKPHRKRKSTSDGFGIEKGEAAMKVTKTPKKKAKKENVKKEKVRVEKEKPHHSLLKNFTYNQCMEDFTIANNRLRELEIKMGQVPQFQTQDFHLFLNTIQSKIKAVVQQINDISMDVDRFKFIWNGQPQFMITNEHSIDFEGEYSGSLPTFSIPQNRLLQRMSTSVDVYGGNPLVENDSQHTVRYHQNEYPIASITHHNQISFPPQDLETQNYRIGYPMQNHPNNYYIHQQSIQPNYEHSSNGSMDSDMMETRIPHC